MGQDVPTGAGDVFIPNWATLSPALSGFYVLHTEGATSLR